jgi:two-component system, sensor histidine kinase RpfC
VDSKTVLVVNDDPVSLLVTQCLVEMGAYQTVCASNGREALELCLRDPPDLVVTDIDMPAMNGLEFALELRRLAQSGQLPHIPILATSAVMTDHREQQCLEAGVRQCFSKPVDSRTFLDAVAACFDNN